MKMYCKTLALTAVISALSMPVLAQSVIGTGSQNMLASADSVAASEAAQMVPAIAELHRTLDADKDSTFNAELSQKVTLSNGTVLPSHTVLSGKVTRDDTQAAETPEFALRLDQAQLKDGKTVPIKATIVGISRGSLDADYAESNDWTSQTLNIEQLNAVSGADLRSHIASDDSALLVSTKKHEVKVPAGSQLKLAIGPATDTSPSTN